MKKLLLAALCVLLIAVLAVPALAAGSVPPDGLRARACQQQADADRDGVRLISALFDQPYSFPHAFPKW